MVRLAVMRAIHRMTMGETLLGWMILGYSRVGMGETWYGVGRSALTHGYSRFDEGRTLVQFSS